MRIARQVHTAPMWKPEHTPETAEEDETSGDRDTRTTARLWLLAIIYGAILTACGIGLTIAATSISSHTGISESFIGAIGTSTLTSLPELVTAVAAVRRGALALAVGDIVGGNSFDTLFAAVSDIAYRDGSIFAAVGNREMFLTVLPLIMSAVLLMGMLRREKRPRRDRRRIDRAFGPLPRRHDRRGVHGQRVIEKTPGLRRGLVQLV